MSAAPAPAPVPVPVPVLTAEPQPGDDVLAPGGRRPPVVRIEIPSAFPQLLLRSPRIATAWHAAVRAHFLWALGNGYTVTGFHRDPVTSRSFYVLEQR